VSEGPSVSPSLDQRSAEGDNIGFLSGREYDEEDDISDVSPAVGLYGSFSERESITY